MKVEVNKIHSLSELVFEEIKELTRHPESGSYIEQDYGDAKLMVELFIKSGFSACLLEMFWQRKSDGCPLEITEMECQLNEFEEWLTFISFENVNDYLNLKK